MILKIKYKNIILFLYKTKDNEISVLDSPSCNYIVNRNIRNRTFGITIKKY